MKAMLGLLAAASLATWPLAAAAQMHDGHPAAGHAHSHGAGGHPAGHVENNNGFRGSSGYRMSGGYQGGQRSYTTNAFAGRQTYAVRGHVRDQRFVSQDRRRFDGGGGYYDRPRSYGYGGGFAYAYPEDGGYYSNFDYGDGGAYYDGDQGGGYYDGDYADPGAPYDQDQDYAQGYGQSGDGGYADGDAQGSDDQGYDNQDYDNQGYDQSQDARPRDGGDWSAGAPPADCGRWVWRAQWNRYQWVAAACQPPCPGWDRR